MNNLKDTREYIAAALNERTRIQDGSNRLWTSSFDAYAEGSTWFTIHVHQYRIPNGFGVYEIVAEVYFKTSKMKNYRALGDKQRTDIKQAAIHAYAERYDFEQVISLNPGVPSGWRRRRIKHVSIPVHDLETLENGTLHIVAEDIDRWDENGDKPGHAGTHIITVEEAAEIRERFNRPAIRDSDRGSILFNKPIDPKTMALPEITRTMESEELPTVAPIAARSGTVTLDPLSPETVDALRASMEAPRTPPAPLTLDLDSGVLRRGNSVLGSIARVDDLKSQPVQPENVFLQLAKIESERDAALGVTDEMISLATSRLDPNNAAAWRAFRASIQARENFKRWYGAARKLGRTYSTPNLAGVNNDLDLIYAVNFSTPEYCGLRRKSVPLNPKAFYRGAENEVLGVIGKLRSEYGRGYRRAMVAGLRRFRLANPDMCK
jgi:hypothetical protein